MTDEPEIKREPKDTDQHPDYEGLTWGDVRAAQRRASDKIAKAQKAEALSRIEEQHERTLLDSMGQTERVRRETENLSPVDRELVSITLALAPQMKEIRIDGVIYHDRLTHTVTRAKAAEMMKIQYEGWRHEAQRKGDDNWAFYAQMNQSQRAPVVINTRKGLISGAAPRGTHG